MTEEEGRQKWTIQNKSSEPGLLKSHGLNREEGGEKGLQEESVKHGQEPDRAAGFKKIKINEEVVVHVGKEKCGNEGRERIYSTGSWCEAFL